MPKRISKNKRIDNRVSDLKTALRMESGLNDLIRKERDQLVDLVDRIAMIVDKNSILLPPKMRQGPPLARAPMHSDMPMWSPDMGSKEYMIQQMHSLISKGELDRYSGAIHFRVSLADHAVAYQLSDESLRHLTKEELYNTIVPEVAQQISYELAKCLKRQ